MKRGNLAKLLALVLVLAQLLCALPALADEVAEEAPEALTVELEDVEIEEVEAAEEEAPVEEVPAEEVPGEAGEAVEVPVVAEDAPAEEALPEEESGMLVEVPEVAEDGSDEKNIVNAKLTIKFDADGGKGTMDPVVIDVTYDEFGSDNDGDSVLFSIPRCQFTKDGMFFGGWMLKEELPKHLGALNPNGKTYILPGELFLTLKNIDAMVYWNDSNGDLGEVTFTAGWIPVEALNEDPSRMPYIILNRNYSGPLFRQTTVELFVGDEYSAKVYQRKKELEANGDGGESDDYELISEETLADRSEEAEQFYIFTSEDESIATIDERGTIKGVKPGETVVRIQNVKNYGDTGANGITDTGDGYLSYTPWCFVIVKAKEPTGVKLTPATATLAKKGATTTLKATLEPEGTTSTLTWSSSDKKVATVDKNGKVTAVAPGTATITVKTANGKKATAKVTVCGIEQTQKSVSIKVKKTAKLQKYVKTYGFKASDLRWTSKNKKIAKVNKKTGKVTGVKKGKTKVTGKVTKNGTTYKVTFTVNVKKPAKGNIDLK